MWVICDCWIFHRKMLEPSILDVVLFTGFLFWLCPSFMNDILQRALKMVDLVTNRMFETFNRFSPSQNHQTDSLSTVSNLKRFSKDQRYKKAISREADVKNRERQLFDIKENAPDVRMAKLSPFVGLSCENCTAASRESLVNKTTKKMALANVFTCPSSDDDGLLRRNFCDIVEAYNLQRFKYDWIDQSVMEEDRVKYAVEKMAHEQYQDNDNDADDEVYNGLVKTNRNRARKLLNDMKSNISDTVLRCTFWIFKKILPCFLSSVLVNPGQLHMIQEASKSNLPIIFLPLHRSHLDYVLITLIMLSYNIRSPIVAAGDNLRIPVFGSLLRGLGAFYIKRRIDPVKGRKDHVYKAVLHTYMNHCLKAGHNVEFFIEGGRTRTGKPVMPKYGILSVIVDSFMDGTIPDALLVPISINYDKLVDGNFVKEQLGEPKKMESFGAAVKALWQVVNSDYGMAKVDFNQPFSLRELVRAFDLSKKPVPTNGKKILKSNPSTTSLYGTDVVSLENKTLIESISRHVLYDSTQTTSIMATNAVAFLMLTKFREGAPIKEFIVALDKLRKDLEQSGRDVSFQGDSIDVINYAVDMLGPALVRKERIDKKEFVKPIVCLPNAIELSYYSNSLLPHYAIDSIIALAINSVENNSGKVNCEHVLDGVNELCDILQYEFIFCKPCQSLRETIDYCLSDLQMRKQIFITENETALESRSRKLAKHVEEEDDDDDVDKPSFYTINEDEEVQEYVKFLRTVVYPLLECYSVTAFSLEHLVGQSLLEGELVQKVLTELRERLEDKSVLYEESVSVDTVKNALKLLIKWEILDCHNEGKLRLYYLKEDSSEAVKAVYNRINKFRLINK